MRMSYKSETDKIIQLLKLINTLDFCNPAAFIERRTRRSKFIGCRVIFFIAPLALIMFDFLYLNFIGMFLWEESGEGAKSFLDDGRQSFIEDYTNSIVSPALLCISYYGSVYYARAVRDSIIKSVNSEAIIQSSFNEDRYSKRECFKKIAILIVIAVIALVGGFIFFFYAGSNESAPQLYWLSAIESELGVCCATIPVLCIFLTWLLSAYLLLMALAASDIFYRIIKSEENSSGIPFLLAYKVERYNTNLSIISMTNLLMRNFALGLFYVGSVAMFIVSDHLTAQQFPGLHPTFENIVADVVIVAVTSSFAVVFFIPLMALYVFMGKQKDLMLHKSALFIAQSKSEDDMEVGSYEKYQSFASRQPLLTPLGGLVTLISSLIIPLLGIVAKFLGK